MGRDLRFSRREYRSLTKMWSVSHHEAVECEMLDDVDRLLDQLGQPELPYRVFSEKIETPGFWPIFRLVSAHPALSRLPGARRRSVAPDPTPVALPEAAWPEADRRVGGPGKIFRRYGSEPASKQADLAAVSDDIRGLLNRLSE